MKMQKSILNVIKNPTGKFAQLKVMLLIPALSLLILISSFDANLNSNALQKQGSISEINIDENASAKTEVLEKQSQEPEEVYTIVQNQPVPTGGMAAFYDYIKQNLKYPEQARKLGIEGKVFVEIIVGPDGKLTYVKAIKGIGAGCDEEAVRVISNSSAWQPGLQDGKAVSVRLFLPISFKLG